MLRLQSLCGLLLVLVWVQLMGCGTSGKTVGGNGLGPAFQAAPGQSVYGKLSLLPLISVEDPALREPLLRLSNQMLRGEDGPKLSPNGSLIFWPPSPGSAWIAEIGEQRVVVNEDGFFSLVVPEGQVANGSLSSPVGNLQPVQFSLASLSPDPNRPGRLLIPVGFRGPCLMSDGDSEEFCSSEEISPRYLPPDYPSGPLETGVLRGARGTYPPPVLGAGCPDTDGPIRVNISEFDPAINLTTKQQRRLSELLAYLGSTCDQNVRDGACINENPLTDRQYRAMLDGSGLTALSLNAFQTLYPSLFQPSDELLSPAYRVGRTETCKLIHKNRICGGFQSGDISVELDGIWRAGQSQTIQVKAGEQRTLVVHNNGAFGTTRIKRSGSPEIVTFDPTPLDPVEPGYYNPDLRILAPDTVGLLHYIFALGGDQQGSSAYQPDRTLRFRVNGDAREGEKVTYRFMVDDRAVILTFEVVENVVKINPAQALLARGESITFTASLDNPPSPGSIEFEWELERLAGRLDTNRGPRVVFTAGGGGVDGPRELLRVTAFLVDAGERRRIGRGSVGIDISSLQILPASARLAPRANQEFTSQLLGFPPTLTPIYEWRSVNGLGQISNSDRASASYTVNSGAQTGQRDVVQLQVFRPTANGKELFAEANVEILIENPANAWVDYNNLQRIPFELAYGNDFFVGLQGGYVSRSADGRSWSEVGSLPNADTLGYVLFFVNGRFLALDNQVLQAPGLYTSPDGSQWTAQASTGGFHVSKVAYGNGKYVAIGTTGGGSQVPSIATSVDLSSWQVQSYHHPGPQSDILFARGEFWVAGASTIAHSADGTVWSANPGGSFRSLLAHGNGVFISYGGSGDISRSSDGLQWSTPVPVLTLNPKSFLFAGDRFLVGGFDFNFGPDRHIQSSSDGLSWTGESTPETGSVYGIAHGNGINVAAAILNNPPQLRDYLLRNPP